jgi:hypothetical protein
LSSHRRAGCRLRARHAQCGVDVVDVDVQHHRRRRVLRIGLAQHHHRVAEHELGVADAAVGPLHLLAHGGAEHGGHEVDELLRPCDHEVRGDGVVAAGDGLCGHADLLSGGWRSGLRADHVCAHDSAAQVGRGHLLWMTACIAGESP